MIDNAVTGASGFIGQHLMNKLQGDYKSVKHGSMFYDNCRNLFFLSAYGNMASHTDVTEMIHANVEDLIWWIRSEAIKQWLCYMSSSSVTLPVQTPYSRTKRAAEEILQALPELKFCIVRPYSVTGVGEQKEHLIPTLIRSCMEGEEMKFDPNPVHDYVNVEDVVDGLIALSEEQTTGVVEFGNGVAISNQKVREIVEWVCSQRANVKEISGLRAYDNQEWYCRTAHPLWKPKKGLYETIDEMVSVYKDERART